MYVHDLEVMLIKFEHGRTALLSAHAFDAAQE